MKLTLPDYKLSTTADNLEGQTLFDDVDQQCAENELNAEDPNDSLLKVDATDCGDKAENTVIVLEGEGDNQKNVCPVCRKSFTSKTWFDKHMEKEHTGHKYSCLHCPKSK